MPLVAERECYDCFRTGLASFIRTAGVEDPHRAAELLEQSLDMVLPRLRMHPPPIAGAPAYSWLTEALGSKDIFHREKRMATESMLERLPVLRESCLRAADPLSRALRSTAHANLIDVAQGRRLPTAEELVPLLEAPLALDDTPRFLERLTGSGRPSTLLVLGDNAGETVLDRLFIEMLPPEVSVLYAVRPSPVLNDATAEDARAAGLDGPARLVSTGLDAPTVLPRACGPEFRELLESCETVLSKGQGNLEGLLGTEIPAPEKLFFAFSVKCPVIARLVGAPERSGVFISSERTR